MPRIRILKNYVNLQEEDEATFSDNNDESEDNEQSSDRTDPSFRQSGGWWSNNSIISGMSEAKIREALAYYRLIINQMEDELIVRRLSGNRNPDISIRGMREARTHYEQAPTKERRRNSPIETFLKRQARSLKPLARSQILEAWSKILKEHYNE